MSEVAQYEVAIVGGGPVGMGLAIDLGQRGVKVIVIERYPRPQQVPKGQNLTQRSVEHFQAWHCEEELRAARITPRGVVNGGLTCYGSLLSGYYYDWLPREQVRPFYNTDVERLPQYATEAVLRQRAVEIPNIVIKYGQKAAALDQDADQVHLTFEDTTTAARETVTASWLVGCDGSRSFVREHASITQTKKDHDRKMVLLVFKSSELHDLLSVLPERSFYNALNPDFGGYWQFLGRVDLGTEWFFHAPVPLGTTKDNFDFEAFLHKAVGQSFPLDLTYVGFWDLRFAQADTYRNERILLAGDAAHSHPPYGGYGINLGFEDARNLGWKLAAHIKGWAGDGLVSSYNEERHPVFASTARDFIENFIVQDRKFLETHNPDGDEPAFRKAWETRNLDASEVFNFEPNYEGSSVISPLSGMTPSAIGSHQMTAKTGHHLAPQPLNDNRMSFEAINQEGYTILTTAVKRAAAQTLVAQAQKAGVPMTLIDSLGDAAVAAYETDFIIMRPDQFVAWTGEIDKVETVLQRLKG